MLSRCFFHKPKVSTRLFSSSNTVAENVLLTVVVGDHSKKTKAELRNNVVTQPRAALKRAQESQGPLYPLLAKRG